MGYNLGQRARDNAGMLGLYDVVTRPIDICRLLDEAYFPSDEV